MKILYFPGQYPFCYYYRGYLPGVYSDQSVVKDFLTVRHDVSVSKIVEQAKKVDVVVFQRPKDSHTLNIVLTLKEMGKKVIFENDDTYLVGKGIKMEALKTEQHRKIAEYFDKNSQDILRICDGAIASTETLAKEYAGINPNVVVLKNCIDPLDEFPCKKNETGKFRIGFIGSVTTNDDYLHIKEQIKQLDARGDVTVVVLGVKYKDGHHLSYMDGDYLFWNSLKNIEWHPYVNVTEYMMTIADMALDLAIIPREESYFNRCKSNIKFLEMSLLGIPVIAQGFSDGTSPYQGADEKHMTVIVDNATWYSKIVEIKDDYKKYKRIAESAKRYVLKDYNISTYAKEWTKAIKKLINK